MLNLAAIEKKIGYVFSNKTLLKTALTHVSYARAHGGADNERLEYLGDAVLELLITEKQYFDSVSTEGAMTKNRQSLVSKLPLKEAVLRMGVAEHLRYFGGKDNVGDKTVSSLYESLLAAVYLDGGMGTLLQAEGLKAGEHPEHWNLSHPEVVQGIHRAYFDAGSHIVNINFPTYTAIVLAFSSYTFEVSVIFRCYCFHTALWENSRA